MKLPKVKNDNDWIAEKILAQEDTALEALAAKRLQDAERGDTAPPELPVEPVAIDPAAERAAYAELQQQFAARDEGDADTIVEELSLEEFTEDSFTPGPRDNPEPQEN